MARDNKKCHGIEFYYIIRPKQQLQMKNYERIENDKGEENLLEFKWVTPEELKDIDLRPTNIRDKAYYNIYAMRIYKLDFMLNSNVIDIIPKDKKFNVA